MYKWLILPKDVRTDEKFDLSLDTVFYRVYVSCDPSSYYITPDRTGGLFLFGYLLPVMEKIELDTKPSGLLEAYKKKGDQFIKDYKGIFTLMVIDEDKIQLFTDHLGVSKFFYTSYNQRFYAASRLHLLGNKVPFELSQINIYEYFLFNYFLKGNTCFENINYSLGGLKFTIQEKIKTGKYFDMVEFLDTRNYFQNDTEVFKKGKELWMNLIKQYTNRFSDRNISLTLTSGLDSRMILAALKHLNVYPETFTFGLKDSTDVKFAVKITDTFGLRHSHFFPGDAFFREFESEAKETVSWGDSLVTLYRSHRKDAYKQLKKISGAAFVGFAASQMIRGVKPCGLLISRLVSNLWSGDEFNIINYIKRDLEKNFLDVPGEIIPGLSDRIANYEFLLKPDQYLFNVIIPLHFGQDIRLMEQLNIYCLCPYWDIEYINFQKNTNYFIDNRKIKEYAAPGGRFKRRKEPFFSSKMITLLDDEYAGIDLGKGYTPRDIAFSVNYSAVKYIFKYMLRNKFSGEIPNFPYGDWYKNFVKHYVTSHDLGCLNIRQKEMIDSIEKCKAAGELGFLHYTKSINIDLIRKSVC